MNNKGGKRILLFVPLISLPKLLQNCLKLAFLHGMLKNSSNQIFLAFFLGLGPLKIFLIYFVVILNLFMLFIVKAFVNDKMFLIISKFHRFSFYFFNSEKNICAKPFQNCANLRIDISTQLP